ncbi:hypothetical protein [Streptomyces sp. B6B3]|uniref:hypothetical protein n=1 Tax=Streptomyces sp. B6B3 TaxID=3153570 RepID=UPI00325D97E0
MPDNGVGEHRPRFPETDGGRDFVAAFREAVVPGERRAVKRGGRAVLPLVALFTEGEERRARARRVLWWLDGCLHVEAGPRAAKLVPHAVLTADELAGDRLVTDRLVARLVEGVPARTGRLRVPNYLLMRDIAEWLRRPDAGAGPAEDATALRDACHEALRRRDRLRGGLWWLGGRDDGSLGGLWYLVAHPLCQVLPRWWWARRCTRRLVWSRRRGWFARAQGLPHGRIAVEFFSSVATMGVHDLERLLLHALFEDLRRATRPTRVSPWRRRRATRYTFLLELPANDGPDGPVRRFLDAYGEAVEQASCTATLLVAVGPAECVPKGVPGSLRSAAHRLAAGADRGGSDDDTSGRPLVVPLPADAAAWAEEGRRVRPVVPRRWRTGPATSAAAQLTGGAAALGLTLAILGPPVFEEHDACLGGSATERAASAVDPPEALPLLAQYQEAVAMIEEQNARADQAARDGETVRTVAYVGTPVSDSWDVEQQRSDGAVPELRGVALAQQELNDEARSDDQKVWLRVELYDAGERYERAAEAAGEIVAAAEAHPEELIGVVGIAQSRDVTREAVEILDAAQIPTIVTNATADAMQVGPYLRQIAPPSSREAEVASHFVSEGNVVEDGAGGCAPADTVIVIQDPTDLYSASVGNDFADAFDDGGVARGVWYTPEPAGGATPTPDEGVTVESSIHGVAESVCARLREDPEASTVVYWAARSREFQAFLNDFGDSTDCSGETLTVVGGNELTNAALSGLYEHPSWLRLYHAAHVLPVGESLSHVAEEFNAHYAAVFGTDDVWRDDGHPALAYDTMQVMAEAANRAYESSGGKSVNRASVQTSLFGGIEKAGVSGDIEFLSGEPVSLDKPMVIVLHGADGPEPVLACGAFAPNADSVAEWGPDEEFDCPADTP